MSEHPIEGLMSSAMNSIRDMIDVNTIVGEAVQAPDGTLIIPISKVSFGFAAGGSEFKGNHGGKDKGRETDEEGEQQNSKLPFGGGSGAGVTINPVAFLVVGKDQVKLLPVEHTSPVDKLIDYMPELVNKVNEVFKKGHCKKEIKLGKKINEHEESESEE